jgi:rhodanese-related sulfurtransferase
MIGRFVNLPFKVLGTVARVVQERDKAQWDKRVPETTDAPEAGAHMSLDVPEDFEPGPIRIQAKRALAGESYLLDIGDAEAWAARHAQDATHIPGPEIDIRLAELPPAVRIVVIGRSTADAERVVRFLRHRGLDDTWALHGGLSAWERAGGPVETA